MRLILVGGLAPRAESVTDVRWRSGFTAEARASLDMAG